MYKADAEIAGGQSRKEQKGPRLVRSGRITSIASYKEVLRLIMSNKDVDTGILHVRGKSVQGDVVIGGGTKILGASTSDGLSGWSAVKALLGVTEGLFQFHDFSKTNIGSLNQGMEVRFLNVIDVMPNFPESFTELNPKNTFNRMRAVDIDKIVQDRDAEQAVLKHVKREVQNFEDKSMKFRAVILWSFCALMTLVTISLTRIVF